jgi:hypothetical protein
MFLEDKIMTKYNIIAFRGDTWNGVQFTINVNGSPKDLTLTTIKMSIRDKNRKIIKTVSSALSSGITITDDEGGTFIINPFIADFEAGSYNYDIQFTTATVVKTYVQGTFTVKQDIT